MCSLADSKALNIPDSDVSEQGAEAADHQNPTDRDDSIARAYLRELGGIPLLTREREIELGKRIQLGEQRMNRLIRRCLNVVEETDQPCLELDRRRFERGQKSQVGEKLIKRIAQKLEELPQRSGGENKKLNHLVEELRKTEADLKAAKTEMIQSNLRLVVRIARLYVNQGLCFLDLIQEGNLGLMRAVTKYDYRRGFRFSTYASWWIRQAVTRALTDKSRTIRIPNNLLELKRKIDKAADHLVRELGRDPSPDEISQKTGISQKNVLKVMDLVKEPISLETALSEDGCRMEDLIEDGEGVGFYDDLDKHRDHRRKTKDLLSFLKPREEQIVRFRFGIGEPSDYSLREIGDHFAISRERVRQIENYALKRLRTRFAGEAGREFF
jgi:RNA polymerase primary sigma factor